MAKGDGTDPDEWPASTGRTEEFLDWLFSGTEWVAFATDDRGTLTWWNDGLEAATGRDRACLDGLSAVDLFAIDAGSARDRLCGVLDRPGRVTLPVATAADGPVPHEFDGTPRTGSGERSCLYAGRPTGGRSAADDDSGDAEGSVRHRRIVETIRDGVFTLDGDWNLVDVNRPLASMLGRDRASLVGTHATEFIAPDGSVERAREAWGAIQDGEVESGSVQLTVRRADGERFPAEVRYGRFPLADGGVGAVGVVRDVTEREERESRLRDRRDDLERLNRIGDAAAAALDPVLEAGSRGAIERRVCERLADTDLYEVVWVGRPAGDGSVVPRTTCGADSGFHEVAERLAGDTDHERSADRAFRAGEAVVHHEGWEAEVADEVREAADGTDLRATMAVPLAYRGTVYGTLTAYSTRENAFAEGEREALRRLGRAVGFAINAVGTRRLVHTHERAELEFRVGPASSVLAAVSDVLDAECVLRWTTPVTRLAGERNDGPGDAGAPAEPSSHDLWLRVAVAGADGESVIAAVGEAEVGEVDVVEARVVDETGAGCTVELRAAGSVPGAVVDAGARPREVVADAGHARVVAEAPAEADLRSVVEAFTDATGAELVAKRSRGGPAERESASRSLTDKQREALRTAEAMGYFDWPREHTAEEVADRLDVASATFHYHLRAAQRTLVRGALDEAGKGEP